MGSPTTTPFLGGAQSLISVSFPLFVPARREGRYSLGGRRNAGGGPGLLPPGSEPAGRRLNDLRGSRRRSGCCGISAALGRALR